MSTMKSKSKNFYTGIILAILLVTAAILQACTTQTSETPQAAEKALSWLLEEGDPQTGGYESDSNSVEALLAIGANNFRAADWRKNPDSASLLDYWIENGAAFSLNGAAESGKLAAGMSASEGCWPEFAKQPLEFYDPNTGIFDPEPGFQAWAVLGTLALEQDVPEGAVEYLKSQVQPDGGWEWNTGFSSDTNTTAFVIQTLIAAGETLDSPLIENGLKYLQAAQNDDGGFTYAPGSPFGTDSDSNSSAYAIQAILAVGQDPQSDAWSKSGNNAIDYLLALQLPDGSLEWQPGNGANFLATAQAIPALLGKSFPFKINAITSCPD
jgi:hypothetical protein